MQVAVQVWLCLQPLISTVPAVRVILAVLSQDSVNVKSDTFGASDLSQLQPLSAFDNSVVITGLVLSSVQV